MLRQLIRLGAVLVCLTLPVMDQAAGQQTLQLEKIEAGWAGALDGTQLWRLPDTPNGLHPTQSWHATGSAPDGNIYVGGMDHATNTALYRIDTQVGTLRYAGDERRPRTFADVGGRMPAGGHRASDHLHGFDPGPARDPFDLRRLGPLDRGGGSMCGCFQDYGGLPNGPLT